MLQKLSIRPDNIYITKLLDIVVPETSEDRMLEWVIIVMEYLPFDLREAIVTHQMRNLTEDHIVVILFNLLSAVEFLHSAGLMHRDLKPANILINSSCQVKLCDFGSARPILLQSCNAAGKPNEMKDARLCPRLRPLSPELDCRSLEVSSALQTLQLSNIKSRKAGSRNKNLVSPKNTEKISTKISGGLAKGLLSPNNQRTSIAHFNSFKNPRAKRIMVNCDFVKSGSKIQKAMKRRQIAEVQR